MRQLKDIAIKPKLIGMFLLIGLIPLLITSFWGGKLASDALMTKAYQQLEIVREMKRAQIKRLFQEF